MKKSVFTVVIFSIFLWALQSPAQINNEYKKGLKYYNSGQYENAVSVFKGYIKDKPRASAYYRIGYALYELGKHEEAYKYFKEAYLIDPDFTPVK
jgi:tetratricopeptide (TPR) repeat protein